jgi:hypothetical protein
MMINREYVAQYDPVLWVIPALRQPEKCLSPVSGRHGSWLVS